MASYSERKFFSEHSFDLCIILKKRGGKIVN